MRLIDADKLMGWFKEHNPFDEFPAEYICGIINEQPTVPQWIPVTERLPKRCRYYLVTAFGEVDEAYYGSVGRWFSDGNILKDVTAWMPLPAPYKED